MKRILSALLACAAFSSAAIAGTVPNFPATPSRGFQSWVQGADAPSSAKAIYTGAANGSKCVAINLVNTDSIAHNFFLSTSTTNVGVITVYAIPASTGWNGSIPSANLLTYTGLPKDSDGNSFIYLKSGDILYGWYSTSFNTSQEIIATAVCMDF